MAQRIFTSVVPIHSPAENLQIPFMNSSLSQLPRLTMLQRARRAATQVLPHICDHFSFHTLFRAHMVSPKSNSNLMWKNSLHVFVFALLSYLEGRPAAPHRLPRTGPVSGPGVPEACGLKAVMTERPSSPGTSAPSVLQVPGILASGTHSSALQNTSAFKN